MEEQQRIQKINELSERMNRLLSRKIMIETAMYFDREKYFQTFEEELKAGIMRYQRNILEIDAELIPLKKKLFELKCEYQVEYHGKVYDPISNSFHWNHENETFYLVTCCDVDTLIGGWNQSIDDPCLGNLISEVRDTISKLKYTEYRISNIKRIK